MKDAGRLVKTGVQRAKPALVLLAAERAGGDAAEGIDDAHEIEERRLARIAGEAEPASPPALGAHELGPAELLEDLDGVIGGDVGAPGELLAR